MLDPKAFGRVPVHYGDVALEGASLTIEPENGVIALRSNGVLLLAHLTREQALAIAMVMALSAERAGADMSAALAMLAPEARAELMTWWRTTDAQMAVIKQAAGHA